MLIPFLVAHPFFAWGLVIIWFLFGLVTLFFQRNKS